MSGFRARLLVAAAIAIGLFLADRAGSYALSQVVIQSGYRTSMVYAGRASADILILGNSVADAMTTAPLIAKETGRSAFMLAHHGLDARTQAVLVEAYIERNGWPEFTIMEMRSVIDREMVAREFAMFGQQSPQLILLAEEQSPTAIPWRRIATLYNFNSRTLPSVLARTILGDDQHESGSNGTINEAKKARFLDRRSTDPVNSVALSAFVDTIVRLQSGGTKVIVVAAPMHPITRATGDYDEVNATTVYKALPKGTLFINALSDLEGDRYFEDPIHMNKAGRIAFAPRLAAALK